MVAAFCVALAFPLVGMVLHIKTSTDEDIRGRERRSPHPKPDLAKLTSDPETTLQSVQSYFNDRFGGRQPLITRFIASDYALFHELPTEDVLPGKDDWLYFKGGGMGDDPGLFQAKVPLTDDQMQAWCDMLEQRRRWLAARGVGYYVVLAPSKSSIYPQYLPAGFFSCGPTRTDQLIAYLKAHSKVKVVDVRPALREEAKRSLLLYEPHDAHWGARAAWIAYNAMVRAIRPDYPNLTPEPADEFSLSWVKTANELAHFAGLNLPAADVYQFNLKHSEHDIKQSYPDAGRLPGLGPAEVYAIANPRLPRVLSFCDSFWDRMRLHLSIRCSLCAFVPGYSIGAFDPQYVVKMRPDFVIQEMVESKLMYMTPPKDPKSIATPFPAAAENMRF
jgi:hypothetical protein